VIEYDGFEHHFDNRAHVNVGNHERYLRDCDVERQLTLESYGYRFLRINRFNLGANPVATLSDRLTRLAEVATGEQVSKVVEQLQQQAQKLLMKQAKPCPKCEEVRPMTSYFDQALGRGNGGYRRSCSVCRDAEAAARARSRSGQRRSGR